MAGKAGEKFGLSTLNNYFREFCGNNIYMPCDAFMDAGCWLERSGNPDSSGILDTGYWILNEVIIIISSVPGTPSARRERRADLTPPLDFKLNGLIFSDYFESPDI